MAEGATLPRGPLYLEDLSVGQSFATGSRTLDEASIKAFAREYDPQPFHLDAEAAKSTFFGSLVASGWLEWVKEWGVADVVDTPCGIAARGTVWRLSDGWKNAPQLPILRKQAAG